MNKVSHIYSYLSSGSLWLKVVPWGIRNMLKFVRDNYGNPPMIITENGVSERNGTLEDDSRITFYRDYINNVLKGMCTSMLCIVSE